MALGAPHGQVGTRARMSGRPLVVPVALRTALHLWRARMSDDDAIADLDIKVVSVTEDDNGAIHLDHRGMDETQALWLLESAKHLILNGYWFDTEDTEGDDDDE